MPINHTEENERCFDQFSIGIGKFIFVEIKGEKTLYSGIIEGFTAERVLTLRLTAGRFSPEKSMEIPFDKIAKTY